MTPFGWLLDKGQCLGCGICADVCPDDAISMERDEPYPAPVPGACKGCGECVRQCPTDAIRLEGESSAAV